MPESMHMVDLSLAHQETVRVHVSPLPEGHSGHGFGSIHGVQEVITITKNLREQKQSDCQCRKLGSEET